MSGGKYTGAFWVNLTIICETVNLKLVKHLQCYQEVTRQTIRLFSIEDMLTPMICHCKKIIVHTESEPKGGANILPRDAVVGVWIFQPLWRGSASQQWFATLVILNSNRSSSLRHWQY